MKSSNFFKLAVVASVVAGSAFLTSTGANAVTGTIGSSVTIGTALSVTGVSGLGWGVMAAPTTGSDVWVMSSAGVLSGGTLANDLFTTDHSAGQFSIDGQNNASVDYSVAITTNFAAVPLTLSALTMSPASPSNLSGTGNLLVDVGGTLTITSAAVAGTFNDAVITLTANY